MGIDLLLGSTPWRDWSFWPHRVVGWLAKFILVG
jgi:hypothetical protein